MVISIVTPAVEGDRLFVSSFYDGSMMLKLDRQKPAIEQLWCRQGRDEQHTDSLHAVLSNPYLDGDYVYGVDSYGELRCLSAATGDRVWENLTAGPNVCWGTIHMVRNGDRTWMFNELGQLLIAQLTPTGFHEISRAQLIEPTPGQLTRAVMGSAGRIRPSLIGTSLPVATRHWSVPASRPDRTSVRRLPQITSRPLHAH